MKKFYLYLTQEERKLTIETLTSKKNHLISDGKFANDIDDVLGENL